METKILVSQFIPEEGLQELFENFKVIMPGKEGFSTDELKDLIQDADLLISSFNFKIDKELLSAGNKLKMIANFGVGYNNIDLEYAASRSIIVSNTPDPVTIPTAEHAMGILLALTRRISEMDYKLRHNQVADWMIMSNLGHSLQGKVLGIVGMGKIGQATSRMAKAFGMQIVYHSRNRIDELVEKELDAKWLPLTDLLQQSDVVSLHVPLTDQTKYLIGAAELKLMKETAYLVNTARGPVVDEQALVTALQNKQIAGAALDVFEEEPKINPDLLSMENVVLTPHIGTGTIETRIATAKCCADNIVAYLKGEKIPNRVL